MFLKKKSMTFCRKVIVLKKCAKDLQACVTDCHLEHSLEDVVTFWYDPYHIEAGI